MKERPILFSGEMVRAIMEGRKTQTRRIVKPQPVDIDNGNVSWYGRSGEGFSNTPADVMVEMELCPFGTVGDRLWVRETCCIAPRLFSEPDETCVIDAEGFKRYVSYKADGHPEFAMRDYGLKWTPSIHMPRWASRITLEITGVRVERLQLISEEDAKAEGIESLRDKCQSLADFDESVTNNDLFRSLWKSIYGPESWNENPWVWVVEFKEVK